MALDEEAMVATLEASGRFKVLRRLENGPAVAPPDGVACRTALFVDVETTGLDANRDEIIELAMVRFTYGPDGTIYAVEDAFHGLREPSIAISPEITRLTGIDASMVAGKAINPAEVAGLVETADLVIAHNAAFDRKFLEPFCTAFVHKPWACTQSQIDWQSEGFEGTRLGYLAQGAGFFYDRHRALNDCHAAVALLARPLPQSGTKALAALLATARKAQVRLFATQAPFDMKDRLRARGYRWNGDGHGPARAWYIDLDEDGVEMETDWLETEIYGRQVDLYSLKIDAFNRFSVRL